MCTARKEELAMMKLPKAKRRAATRAEQDWTGLDRQRSGYLPSGQAAAGRCGDIRRPSQDGVERL